MRKNRSTRIAVAHRVRRAAAVSLALCALLSAVDVTTAPRRAAARHSGAPNVLIILTDDQRAGNTLKVMPETRARFAKNGTRFTQAFATTPLCCPSRASIMTGRYAHNHGVKTNADAGDLDHSSTLQRYMDQSGYRTAIFGKFLNGWDLTRDPPYFDDWAIGGPSRYYGGSWNVQGSLETVEQYSTDFVAGQAVAFLEDAERDDSRPWLMYVAPGAPHMPAVAEADYIGAPIPRWHKNRAVLEKHRGDKPPYVQARDAILWKVRRTRARQLRSLLSADDLVTDVFDKLGRLDENASTLAFFLSDNGFMWGEHGLSGSAHNKRSPYTQSSKIPFMMRWPGHVSRHERDGRLVATIDIVPTVLDATGVAPNLVAPLDGDSLLQGGERSQLLLEHWTDDDAIPEWASLRSKSYQYVEYYGEADLGPDFREYYDLKKDRWQLRNLLGDARDSNDPETGQLAAVLDDLRHCRGNACP
ncbi:MAG: sulfatase [Actinomycetota bacterium]